jgi:hypothetical protein
MCRGMRTPPSVTVSEREGGLSRHDVELQLELYIKEH